MKKWLAFGVSLSIVLLTRNSLAASCNEPVKAPQYQVGDRYTWKYQNGKEATWDVVGFDNNLAQIKWTDQTNSLESEKEGMYFIDQNWIRQKGANSKGEVVLPPAMGAFSFLGKNYLDFPLQVGKKWSFTYQTRSVAGPPSFYRLDLKVVGCEEVTTRAGKFLSLKIESTQTNVAGGSGWGTIYRWYSPDAKNIIKIEFGAFSHNYWLNNNPPPGYELIRLELK